MKKTTTKTKAPAPAPEAPRRGTEEILFELRDLVRTCHLAAWAIINDRDQWPTPRPPAEAGVMALQYQLERATKLLDEFPL